MITDKKGQTRFAVYTAGIPAFLIKGYQFSKTQLILTTWVKLEDKIMDHINAAKSTYPIKICIYDDNGNLMEEIVFETHRLVDWNVTSDWTPTDQPLEIKFTYELN